jgi:serine/threonine protein kinase
VNDIMLTAREIPMTTQHPSNEQLLDFLHGRLRHRELLALETHLRLCDGCITQLSKLESSAASDPLLELMRDAVLPDVADETPLPSSTRLQPELLGHPRWAIQSLISMGRDGPRYCALDRTTSGRVTLKLVTANPQVEHDLKSLCEFGSTHPHPSCAAPHHVERLGVRLLIATNYFMGTSLQEVVCNSGRLPLATVCQFVSQAVTVFSHAHAHAITHGDLTLADWILNDSKLTIVGWDRQRLQTPVPHDPRVDAVRFGRCTFGLLVGQTNWEYENTQPPQLWDDTPEAVGVILRASMNSEYESPQHVVNALHAAIQPSSWWRRWSPI